ncbi:hypothetical protein LCGC14_2397200 [marine sediment metagenome]|uniref:Uncharacterized protein n=1 Tax=marine sediment metagenome TaxID=412755 RepID=A0A0F9BWG8_9ZZZZ
MSYPLFWVHEEEGHYVVEFTGNDGIARRIAKLIGTDSDSDVRALIGEAKTICSQHGVVATSKDVLVELIGETTIAIAQMRAIMDEIKNEREQKWSFRIKRKIASIKQAVRARFKRGE